MVTTQSGLTVYTPEHIMELAKNPFARGDGTPFGTVKSLLSYLSGPFNSMDPLSDDLKFWYEVPAGNLFWIVVTLL
ncbi:MAG: hypothetical protein IJ856_00590, partial [Candidatus Methanomethylophilaceae archaeon]|nr:hypothetical protein [Candidatus Methanomethylophilaceae archaeon]